MKKAIKRKIITMLAGAICVISLSSTSTFAASNVYGSIGGYSVSGSVSLGSSSATATTRCAVSAGMNVTSYYKYGVGTSKYVTSAYNSNASTSVSATATYYGATSLGAQGDHNVYYNQYSWHDVSTTGESIY